ncbi:MAG: HlyD family secretion protein [Verrucomicrobia bacterium]|nr:HlyD family secretion protein [Verrucomicrobiota bacterium]MDE3047444.1 HlyD family secretion protein [Verrucomicrobiota bacterium]
MDETPTNPKKTISWKMLFSGLGVFLIVLAGIVWYLHARKYVWTNDAYLDGYQIQISADIEARIITLYVDEGDTVRQGDLLCQLDESIYNSQREDALTNVDLLQETVKLQKIEMEKLRDIYRVAKQEYDNQIISYIDFDKIEKDFHFAMANFKVAEANLKNGIAKLGVIEEWLRHTKIYAPRDGAISKRWVVAGDVAQIGQPLFGLTDVNNIWVTANLEENKVGHLQPGDPVEIHIDAYPDRTFTGSVFVVRAAAASQFSLIPPDNATGNFTKVVQRLPVKIWLNVPESKEPLYLYPGMSAEIHVKVR